MERKTRSKDARMYMRKFRLWDKGVSDGCKTCKRETLYSQDYGNPVAFTPKDDEVFVQCYTADKKAKFYKARHYLPKYWFISQYGNLISFKGENGFYVKPSDTGKKADGKQREAYKPQYIRDCKAPVNLDVGLLFALSFGYEATSKAQKLLDSSGLKALKRGEKGSYYVEIHHQQDGYKFAEGTETLEETFARRAYNCQRKRLLLIRNDEHNLTKLQDDGKIMHQLPHIATGKSIVTLVKYPGPHGTYQEGDDSDVMQLFDNVEYVNAEYVNTEIFFFNNEDCTALKSALAQNSSITINALKQAININRQQPDGQTGIEYDIPLETGQTISVIIKTMENKG